MSVNGSYQFKTTKQLFREREMLDFGHTVQRGLVWKNETQSLFIHSMMTNFPWPPIYCVEAENGTLAVMDGKQRLNAVFSFLMNGYALGPRTPDVNGIKVAGKKFKNLPEHLRDLIESASFQIYQYRGLDEEQIKEMFLRLNHGMSLTRYEKNRVTASLELLQFIQGVTEKPFFQVSINLTSTQRVRYADEEILIWIMMLLRNDRQAVELSAKSFRKYMKYFNDLGVSLDLTKQVIQTTDYLGEAFPVQFNRLRKVHIPTLFVTATYAVERNVPPFLFASWAEHFFKYRAQGQSYTFASMTGSNRSNVQIRLSEMKADLEEFLTKKQQNQLVLLA